MPPRAWPCPLHRASTADPDGDGDDDAGQRDPEGIMTMTSQMVALLAENYQVFLAGRGQVAGRPAQELVLRHRDGRLAARFWLDNATKLPLRRETFDGQRPDGQRGRVREPQARLTRRRGGAAHRGGGRGQAAGHRAAGPAAGGGLAAAGAAARPAQPGPGERDRRPVRRGRRPGLLRRALSVISLFVQRGHLPAAAERMVRRSPCAVIASTRPGRDQRSVAWSARGFVYTLIADAPDQTLDQVVGVLPHNGGPGFFGRMGRGLQPPGLLARPVPVSPGVRAARGGSQETLREEALSADDGLQ